MQLERQILALDGAEPTCSQPVDEKRSLAAQRFLQQSEVMKSGLDKPVSFGVVESLLQALPDSTSSRKHQTHGLLTQRTVPLVTRVARRRAASIWSLFWSNDLMTNAGTIGLLAAPPQVDHSISQMEMSL